MVPTEPVREDSVPKRTIGALIAAIALAANSAAAEDMLRFGQVPSAQRSVSSLPLFVAEREGYFVARGLRIETIPIAGGTDKMVASLAAGTTDVVETATPYLITAVLGGSDAVAIAGEVGNPIYTLVAKPEIADFAALKGRTVGLSLALDTISYSTRKLLALHGLGPGEFRVEEVVGTPARFACLKSGTCDAVPLGQPDDFVAEAAGFRRLGTSTEAVPSFQFQVIAARRAWADAHAGLATRFVAALAQSFRYIHNPTHRQALERLVVAKTGVPGTIAHDVLRLYLAPGRGPMPRAAEIDRKGFAAVISFLAETGALKPPLPPPERFIDLRYLRRAGAG
jgi:ABC-type nitrate/sulfonate/bicarbonate transport system substrate-binding protein